VSLQPSLGGGRDDRLTVDLRWEAAIGWPMTAKASHDTTLTCWRRRLAASAEPDRTSVWCSR
jgi:hypothetical protein